MTTLMVYFRQYTFSFLCSVTKSAFFLSFVLAYNHAHSLLDPAPLVLLGGCVLVSVRLWNLHVRTVDPFLSPQGMAWQLLTCLSVTPTFGGTKAGEGGMAMKPAHVDTAGQRDEGVLEEECESKNTLKQGPMTKQFAEEHLKHD